MMHGGGSDGEFEWTPWSYVGLYGAWSMLLLDAEYFFVCWRQYVLCGVEVCVLIVSFVWLYMDGFFSCCCC